MSWILAFVGFAALIIFHEIGHFAAAKAVGMRVERFSLFFGKPLVSFRRGETEYAIGPYPLGGYVTITGMNPRQEIELEVEHRAYYRQAVWKRIFVISAGPAVNILIAFVIFWALLMINGQTVATQRVGSEGLTQPATRYLEPGDRIVSVDGVGGDAAAIAKQVSTHRCAGTPKNGCDATTPARVVVERDGERRSFEIRPRYDATEGIERTRLGFSYAAATRTLGPVSAADLSVTTMWDVTTASVTRIVRLFDAEERKQLSGVVGSYEVTRQSFGFSFSQAMAVLGLISLSLAVINLFPFLPLDGGHIFWALAEKLRGRPISFSVMEGASAVGFVLVILLFVVGLSNDIGRLQNGGFDVR